MEYHSFHLLDAYHHGDLQYFNGHIKLVNLLDFGGDGLSNSLLFGHISSKHVMLDFTCSSAHV